MRKALFLTLLLAFASALCWPSLAKADSMLSVQSPLSVNDGTSFSVSVDISSAVDLFTYQLDLGFDPTILRANSVSEGDFLPGEGTTFFVPGTIDNIGGFVTFNGDTLIGGIPGQSNAGTLLQFDFTAIGSGTSALSLSNLLFLDSSFNTLTQQVTNGSVVVNPVVSTPESSMLVFLAVAALFFLVSRRAWRIN